MTYQIQQILNDASTATGGTGTTRVGIAVALSVDGNYLVVGSSVLGGSFGGGALIYKKTGSVWAIIHTYLASTGGENGRQVAVSQDGSVVVVGGLGNAAVLRRDAADNYTEEYTVSGVSYQKLDLSQDGNLMAVSDQSGEVRVYRFNSTSWVQDSFASGNTTAPGGTISVKVKGDGSVLLVAGVKPNGDAGVTFYQEQSGVWTPVLSGLDSEIFVPNRCVYSADGKAIAFQDTTADAVRVYRESDGSWTSYELKNPGVLVGQNWGRAITLSQDGGVVAVASYETNRTYKWENSAYSLEPVELVEQGLAFSFDSTASTLAVGQYSAAGGGQVAIYFKEPNTTIEVSEPSITIISQTETEITVSSLNFLQLPEPERPDFNIFVPCDVNTVFDNLQLVIPHTDVDPNDPQADPDQDQPVTGTYDNSLWRSVYEDVIMGTLADTVSRYVPDMDSVDAAALKSLFELIICELFLGKPLVEAGAGLTVKTEEHIKPWLNGEVTNGWGQKCFQATQFDTIVTQLVAARKYERVDAGQPTEHGQVQLVAGDSIGVRVKLIENPDNFLHVNFYLQQSTALFNITLPITLWSEMAVYQIFNHNAGESLEYDSTLPIEYTNFTSGQLAFSNTLNDGISGLDSTDNFQFTPSAINIRSNIGDVWGIRFPQGALRTITGVQCAEVNFTVTFGP